MTGMRLDKYLADMGVGTRSQVKELIRKGRVTVDGSPEKDPGRKLADRNQVAVQGQTVGYVEYEYFMLNKPQGVVSATEDSRYPTVISLIKGGRRKDLFPVGRLDIDTEGLLLITNDGALAHRLLSPSHHVDKQYQVWVDGVIPEAAVEQMAQGILLHEGSEEKRTMPAKLEILGMNQAYLTIQEGRFHQVKRMFAAIGLHVTGLKRLRMGPLVLDPGLAAGEYRPLTVEERKELEAC